MLANILEDDNNKLEIEDSRLDIVLRFLDGRLFKKLQDIRDGKTPRLEGEGEIEHEPASIEFYDEVKTLPTRRANKPPLVDEYINKKAVKEKAVKVTTAPEVESNKKFSYERKILIKRKNG